MHRPAVTLHVVLLLYSVTFEKQVINTLFNVTFVIFALFYFCNVYYFLIPCRLGGNSHD